MEKLLHQSKGVPLVMIIANIIVALICVGYSIYIFDAASSERLSYLAKFSSHAQSAQMGLWIAGALLLACGAYAAYFVFFVNRTFLLVYENHVEGLNCFIKYGFLPVTERIHVSYRDIQQVDVRKKMLYNCVYLLTTTAEYKVQVKDAPEAVRFIRQKIRR